MGRVLLICWLTMCLNKKNKTKNELSSVGVPQGSILRPLLFSGHCCEDVEIKVYADIYAHGRVLKPTEMLLKGF